MPLKPVPELFAAAYSQGYSLGYFECWNLESLQGIIDAAEQTRSPIIIGFNGEFLTDPGRLVPERTAVNGALGRAVAEASSVPCALIFNECPIDSAVFQAVDEGFNLVMLADPEASYEDYAKRVASLVKYAHAHGAAVEAEIGELPVGSSGSVVTNHSSMTDPELAADFVKRTGVDLLSVSVGNIHVLLGGSQDLDLDRLEAIHQRVGIPLGLHGGTSISSESLQKAVRMGVTKVAYGTYLKQRYLVAMRKAYGNIDVNPHELLGKGKEKDIMVAGRLTVRDAVLERIELLGCCGKA